MHLQNKLWTTLELHHLQRFRLCTLCGFSGFKTVTTCSVFAFALCAAVAALPLRTGTLRT